jgi:glycosyltransferase involved in cell wall biosynthesis
MDVKFSVVVPTIKGREVSLERTLNSIKGQTVQDYEIIVVDGKEGKAKARNDGMKLAVGEWICWLDDDDWYFPTYLEVMCQAMEKYPDTSLFTVGGVVFWNDWKMTVRMPHPKNMGDVFMAGIVMSGGFVYKKSCIDKTGYLPEHGSPYEFGRMIREQHPELAPLYKNRFDLGNPYGDDFSFYYKLTRHYQPIHLNTVQFGVMIRGTKQLP